MAEKGFCSFLKWPFMVLLLLIAMGYANPSPSQTALPLSQLVLPTGFSISIYAQVPGARSMTLGQSGIVYVGSRHNGRVYALIPNLTLTHAKRVITIAEHLNSPNGVAFYKGDLYVAEIDKLWRFPHIDPLKGDFFKKLVRADLPTNPHHGWRYIKFSTDGWLYMSIGAPCNICFSKDKRFASIVRMKPNGTKFQIYAQGIRNSVGFDWNPKDKSLWFSDNGRDWLGDNLPPDEVNRAPKQQLFFGYPFYYGNMKKDPKFNQTSRHRKIHNSLKGFVTRPTVLLPAHVAPLGMCFYTGHMFPKSYDNQIFLALHGSWNRSRKVGYKLISIQLKGNKAISIKPFISGWLQGQQVWGRPVDVLVMPDGALLVSDDYAGVVYRISYSTK